MPVVSSFFLIVALVFAVTLGPQTRPWSWGPAMLALGSGVLAALPVFWRKTKGMSDPWLLGLGLVTCAWFAFRACGSPVWEDGEADFLLLAAAVGAFVCLRAISGEDRAEQVLLWGTALILSANIGVVIKQILEPGFTPVFREREEFKIVSGFFGHYIEAANFLAATSAIVMAAGLLGKQKWPSRVILVLIAAGGFAAVWFTRGRAGILGAAVALGVLAAMALIVGKRREAKWFAPALIGIPIIFLGVGAFWWMGWTEAQEVRNAGVGAASVMDNHARLYFLGIALSCLGLHPLAGGGSRSFSWESFHFSNRQEQGDLITHTPEFVHNEFMQAATDYGLVGFGLLGGLIATLLIGCILRMVFEDRPNELDSRDAWRIGGMAALAGMLTQAFFGFVFHLMPGILLLGISFGMISKTTVQTSKYRAIASCGLLTIAGLACITALMPMGWKGSILLKTLWPVYFSKFYVPSPEAKADCYGQAISIWPQSEFFRERGAIYQKLADDEKSTEFERYARLAIQDYLSAQRLHPYDPASPVNLANVYSSLGLNTEAENHYAKAIRLQGGMEPAFRGCFFAAIHFHRKALRDFDPKSPASSLQSMEMAAIQMETAVKMMHWIVADMKEPRVSIHESLGMAREAAGNRDGALGAYDFASKLQGGNRVHYRASLLIGRIGRDAWAKRRASEALQKFLEAHRRLGMALGALPEGVTLTSSVEFKEYLEKSIALLRAAKIEPQ